MGDLGSQSGSRAIPRRQAKRAANPGAKRIRFLDPNEVREFLDAVGGDRHATLYNLAVTTGLRPEELYGLRWKDVDIDARRLTVNQVLSKTRRKKGEEVARFQFGPPKTEKSRRTIDFPEFVGTMLTEERRLVIATRALAGDRWDENSLVFPSEIGTPLEERNVLRRFQSICEANELPKLRVYDLRHTHASLLIHEGVHPKKISERLGTPRSSSRWTRTDTSLKAATATLQTRWKNCLLRKATANPVSRPKPKRGCG
jgi:integrase